MMMHSRPGTGLEHTPGAMSKSTVASFGLRRALSQSRLSVFKRGACRRLRADRRYAGDSSVSVQSRGAGSPASSLCSASPAARCTASHGLLAHAPPA